ncbi:MAG: 8-oxo-dGTP pyrophosphatase MutT (NUDIX family) [Myxococcota bacterium]|jgi:8-oxo-dGTP pyrophosphatase MutT (NUDIX family)
MMDQLSSAIHRRTSVRVKSGPQTRHASVAAVLRPGGDLLLIQRSIKEGDPWSGHMAFPGGRAEPHDDNIQTTAMRECFEEVGLDLSGARMLGRLDDNISPSRQNLPPRLVISAFVFAISDPAPILTPNHEVAEVLWFGLDRFVAEEERGTMPFTWRGHEVMLPEVRLEGAHIWGLTLRIIDDLCSRVRATD